MQFRKVLYKIIVHDTHNTYFKNNAQICASFVLIDILSSEQTSVHNYIFSENYHLHRISIVPTT